MRVAVIIAQRVEYVDVEMSIASGNNRDPRRRAFDQAIDLDLIAKDEDLVVVCEDQSLIEYQRGWVTSA